jgi:GNAT superfamily N-acetyltransferase
MKSENWEAVNRYWARELGMDAGLGKASAICCTVQHLYSGVQLFRDDERLIIACPPTKAKFVQNAVAAVSPEEVFSVEWLQRVFAQDAERIVGPAEVHYADETSFRSERSYFTRPLSAADSAAYSALVAALDSKEVEDSGSSSRAFPALGAFSDRTLFAVASYKVWEPSIAHITVATHRNYRRRGFAKAAVGAPAAEALGRGLILQWRAVAWNKNSLSLARDLGFKYYCSTLYVRIRNAV